MLALSMAVGERIFIGDDVVITLYRISECGKHAKMAFDAPAEVMIDRESVRRRKDAGKEASLGQGSPVSNT